MQVHTCLCVFLEVAFSRWLRNSTGGPHPCIHSGMMAHTLPRKVLTAHSHKRHTQSREGERVRPVESSQGINKWHSFVISHLSKFLPIKGRKDLEITKLPCEDFSKVTSTSSTGNRVHGEASEADQNYQSALSVRSTLIHCMQEPHK